MKKMLLNLVAETKLAEMSEEDKNHIIDNPLLSEELKQKTLKVKKPKVTISTKYGERISGCTLTDIDDNYLQFETIYTSIAPNIPVMAVMQDVILIDAIAGIQFVKHIIGDIDAVESLDIDGYDEDDEFDLDDDE